MKTKGIPYSKVKEKSLMNNDVLKAYLVEKRGISMRIIDLHGIKVSLNGIQVAKIIGIE